jgi:hypothetical protein
MYFVSASAQQSYIDADTNIRATTIEITQIYQPQIKQAVKEQYSPTLPPIDKRPVNFSYEVPSHVLNYSYKPLPLQALSIGRDTSKKTTQHYVKAGLGNLNTIFVDAGLGNLYFKNTVNNAHLGFLMQKGSLAYQRQSIASFDAESIYRKQKIEGIALLQLTQSNFNQYGFDQQLYPLKTATKQSLSGARIQLALDDKRERIWGLDHHIGIGASYFIGNTIDGEMSLSGTISSSKRIDSNLQLIATLEGMSTQLRAPLYATQNNYASLKLGGLYFRKNKQLHAFLIPSIGQKGNTYLLADIGFAHIFPQQKINFSAGLKGSLTQNTYHQLFAMNPFISQFPSIQTHSNEIFASASKGLGHHLHLHAKMSWWQYEHFANFLNAPLAPEQMLVTYIPKMNALSSELGIDYQIANTLSIHGVLCVFKYYNISGQAHVWQTPNTQLGVQTTWQVMTKLNLTAYANYWAGNFAQNAALQTIKLNPIVDLGCGGEYQLRSKLSLFLTVNNLLNNKYQRWLGYQAYGINIYGGVRLKF